MNFVHRPRSLRAQAVILAVLFLLGSAAESDALGRGSGGGSRGGGRGGLSGISRGGPARGGSIRSPSSGGSYRDYSGSRSSRDYSGSRSSRDYSGSRSSRDRGDSTRRSGYEGKDSYEREGSFETRRGETVDYSSTINRTEDGIEREGSWTSTSGASGGGNSSATIRDGQVQSTDRSRYAEGASGETINREIESERDGDHIDRSSEIKSSTGIDAETWGQFQKTDDGFIARGGIYGNEGAARGSIVRDGDDTYIRGAATDGDGVTWGRAHCNGSHCYGGRVTADVYSYYRYPYYYYPYYYGWYSCPYGNVTTWHSHYGTPIYSCSNVVVISTTISMGVSESSYSVAADTQSFASAKSGGASASATAPKAREAKVSSAPVLMYEIDADVVAYATTYEPTAVYSVKKGEFYYWVPGPEEASDAVDKWSASAADMKQPTANSTVITYTVDEQIVYLTNERPAPGFYAKPSAELFVWIPGVQDPTDSEKAMIEEVIKAQAAGGRAALDREARKLEEGHEAPPASAQNEIS